MGTNTVKNTAIEKKKDAAVLIRDHGLFWCLFLGMGIYYICRMFSVPPWYDELYTYENFIDRGMIYSMIHWPLPNNHVFYSALSAILNKLGNPYIGLRGVSFLASMGSLLLLYRILKKGISTRMAAAGTALFAAMYNVVQQAAQGRGYALSGFFLLAAVNCLYEICIPEKSEEGKGKRRFWYYAGFAASLTGGLYTIPSNLYWVVPVCMAGGLYLLFTGEYKKLFPACNRFRGGSDCDFRTLYDYLAGHWFQFPCERGGQCFLWHEPFPGIENRTVCGFFQRDGGNAFGSQYPEY